MNEKEIWERAGKFSAAIDAVNKLVSKMKKNDWCLEQDDLEQLVDEHGADAAYRLGLLVGWRRNSG